MLTILPRSTALASTLVALLLSNAGCSSVSSCNRDEDSIQVDGFVNAERTIFSSLEPVSLFDADGRPLSDEAVKLLPPFTHFPANRSITFHVGLAADPTSINIFLSFSPLRNRTVAPAAGNQGLIRSSNKNQIVVRNDTCTEFWIWLTASTSATPLISVADSGVVDGAAGTSGIDLTDTAGAPNAP